MFQQYIRPAALAAALAGAAVPAGAAVYQFDIPVTNPEVSVWSFTIDFGDFGFDTDRTDITTGISGSGIASYYATGNYAWTFDSDGQDLTIGEAAGGAIMSFSGSAPDFEFVFQSFPTAPDFSNFGSIADSFELHIDASFSATVTEVPTTTPIPLPAAGWLLVAGLGAIGLVRRRGGR